MIWNFLGARRLVVSVSVVAVTVAMSSCSLGPNDIPVTQSDVGTGFELDVHFASVMNLPTGAYVMLDGVRVGEVTSMEANPEDVVVRVDLREGTRVPVDVRAVIRQDTLLGDTYIGFEGGGAIAEPTLSPGASIPVTQTVAPPQIEDTMSVLAYFVNGGTIQRVQDTLVRLNNVMPSAEELRTLSDVVARNLDDLSANTAEIDTTLTQLDLTAVTAADRAPTLDFIVFRPEALRYWERLNHAILGAIGKGLPSVGSLFSGGYWLNPLLNSLASASESGRGTYDGSLGAIDSVSNFVRTVAIPFANDPAVKITSVRSPDGRQLMDDMTQILRMLGAVK